MVKTVLVAIAFCVVLFFTTSSAQAGLVASNSQCPGQNDYEAKSYQQMKTMSCLINHARQSKGMKKLDWSSHLEKTAKKKAQDIIKCNSFSHTPCGNDFTKYYEKGKYLPATQAWGVGENIAWGSHSEGYASPRDIFQAWLNSPEHRDNIFTSSWRHQAVYLKRANFQGFKGAHVWVSEFGYGGNR